MKKKLHTRKAKCPPSLIAWRNGGGCKQYPPSATSLRRGTKIAPHAGVYKNNMTLLQKGGSTNIYYLQEGVNENLPLKEGGL